MVATRAARLRDPRIIALLVTLLTVAAISPAAFAGRPRDGVTVGGEFPDLFEPSGITQLSDGRLLIVEDEPHRALRRFAFDPDGERLRLVGEATLQPAGGLIGRLATGPLDDVEGVARDPLGRLYVIGSHDDAGRRRRSDRQKLLRFSIDDGEMVDIALSRRLSQDLAHAYPALADALERKDGRKALNIEALAYDRRRGVLLIGLRSPRIDERAVIVRLLDPEAYVEGSAKPAFADSPWTVDLDEGGLRAMCYDDLSDQLLMVSHDESGGGANFKLWRMAADGGHPPLRIRLPEDAQSLDHVEGLTPVERVPVLGRGVLFVRDDGERAKGRGAHWFVLERERLGLGPREER